MVHGTLSTLKDTGQDINDIAHGSGAGWIGQETDILEGKDLLNHFLVEFSVDLIGRFHALVQKVLKGGHLRRIEERKVHAQEVGFVFEDQDKQDLPPRRLGQFELGPVAEGRPHGRGIVGGQAHVDPFLGQNRGGRPEFLEFEVDLQNHTEGPARWGGHFRQSRLRCGLGQDILAALVDKGRDPLEEFVPPRGIHVAFGIHFDQIVERFQGNMEPGIGHVVAEFVAQGLERQDRVITRQLFQIQQGQIGSESGRTGLDGHVGLAERPVLLAFRGKASPAVEPNGFLERIEAKGVIAGIECRQVSFGRL